MPGVMTTLSRGSTITYSWLAVDSTLPFTLRLNDRRTGVAFSWSSNNYIVRIGSTTGVSAFSDGRFLCPAGFSSGLSQPSPGLCRT